MAIEILYEDEFLLAVNKPNGVPVQADLTKDPDLFSMVVEQQQLDLHLIHRIDRPVSGIVLFAKDLHTASGLFKSFKDRTIKKTYLALVKNLPDPPAAEIKHYIIAKKGENKVIVKDHDARYAKRAILHYKHLGSSTYYHLLEIQLITGRKHQIRAQLSKIGAPIWGDVKYGFRRSNKDRSVGLHSYKKVFIHPITNQEITITAAPPKLQLWDSFEELF